MYVLEFYWINVCFLLNLLNEKKMPFEEPGCQKLLERSKILFTNDLIEVKNADHIIITVGTPLLQHIETELSKNQSINNYYN